MGRPGWRLGGRRYHLVGATTGGWARRHPPKSSDHVSTASRGNAESRRESLDRATRRVRQDLVWLRKDPSNQAADDRLRVDRFSAREKFGDWTESNHDPESVLTREDM